MQQLLEKFGHIPEVTEQESTEYYARMAAENIKFIIQKNGKEVLEGATHKVNNYRGLLGSIVSEESSFPKTSNTTTGEQLLIHLCYSLLRELKDVIVWNAFHQEDKHLRDWLLQEVFDVEIRVEEEVLNDSEQDSSDQDLDDGQDDYAEEL